MRYFKITILLGSIVALIIAGLLKAGVFRLLDPLASRLLDVPLPTADAWPVGEEWALTLFSIYGIMWTTLDINRLGNKCVIFLLLVAELFIAAGVVTLHGRYLPVAAPITGAALSFFVGLLFAQTELGRRKRLLHEVFGERISRKAFVQLLNSPNPLNLEGQRTQGSVLICEIFNHDELVVGMNVRDYVALNNSFLENASAFIVEQGGYLDECDGECLRAFFGAPLPDDQHAVHACATALAVANRLDAVNVECMRLWKHRFDFRVAVNSGETVVATYGSRRHSTYSVAGESVEFARRLCAANTMYGTRILIGASTFQAAENAVEVRPIEIVQRHADERSREEIYELLAPKGALTAAQAERRDAFWEGVIYFRENKWKEAESSFRRAQNNGHPDAPLDFYLRRLEPHGEAPSLLVWTEGADAAHEADLPATP